MGVLKYTIPIMLQKKKVIWNAGQVPERNKRPRMPIYIAEPTILDEDLNAAWSKAHVGQMCIVVQNMMHRTIATFPYQLMFVDSFVPSHEQSVCHGTTMLYLGRTYIECIGSKEKIISRPYITVLLNGAKFLVVDPNSLKPIV